ncbi:hypothetical protein HOI83_03300 [Candidatus Uhrbacteria bacterium]|jgi:hypothetical protein|nr:hypothetical protein [Candidatus Uhrbacteria bacterium]
MRSPFISVTDVMTRRQVLDLLQAFRGEGGDEIAQTLAVGVMTGRKVLTGLSSEWSEIWPKPKDIAGIFLNHPDVFNVLHYVDYTNTQVLVNLNRARQVGGKYMDAIQLDMCWPDPTSLCTFKRISGDIKIILQVGRKAFDEVGNDPARLATRLMQYIDSVDYILLDRSMGEGLPMDAADLARFVQAIKALAPVFEIVVAGGLGPYTMDLVEPLVELYPDISIDAQGQLCYDGDSRRSLSEPRVLRYLEKAVGMFRKHQGR